MAKGLRLIEEAGYGKFNDAFEQGTIRPGGYVGVRYEKSVLFYYVDLNGELSLRGDDPQTT